MVAIAQLVEHRIVSPTVRVQVSLATLPMNNTQTQQDRSGRLSGSKVAIASVCFGLAAAMLLVGGAAGAIESGIVVAFVFCGLGAAVLCKSAM